MKIVMARLQTLDGHAIGKFPFVSGETAAAAVQALVAHTGMHFVLDIITKELPVPEPDKDMQILVVKEQPAHAPADNSLN